MYGVSGDEVEVKRSRIVVDANKVEIEEGSVGLGGNGSRVPLLSLLQITVPNYLSLLPYYFN